MIQCFSFISLNKLSGCFAKMDKLLAANNNNNKKKLEQSCSLPAGCFIHITVI